MLESMDVLLLSRLQFAFTVSFHIIFPAFTIGLASFLAVIEGLWLKTKKPVYREIYKLWIKIFAVSFGMGVVSGVVLSYQFGTNWSAFSDMTGNVLGPLLGYEVLTAFFLEASFLGIMLFGWDRVSPRMHFTATLIVAIGTVISAFWILSANSWMQTPQGFEIRDGIFYPTNWIEVIFNPSFPYRLFHMLVGAYLTTAFVVGGVAGWYLLRGLFKEHARIMLGMAMLMALFVAPIQAFIGDLHGLNTLKHQPAKVAAMEGIWETEKGAPLTLIGFPDAEKEETVKWLAIPKMASLILTHDLDGEIKGLKEWPKEERPPVGVVFWSFRVMVAIGTLMILTGVVGAILYMRRRLFDTPWFSRWWVMMSPLGFVAILAGWYVTEVGRQPYLVYGFLRTADSVSPVSAAQVFLSFVILFVVYMFVFGAGIFYIFKLIRKGPLVAAGNVQDTYGAQSLENAVVAKEVPKGK